MELIELTEKKRLLMEGWACLLLANAHKFEKNGDGNFKNNPFHTGAYTLLQALFLLGYKTHGEATKMFNEMMDRVSLSVEDLGLDKTIEIYSVNKILNETLKV